MVKSQRKVAAELLKVWESVIAKGKVKSEEKITDIKSWLQSSSSSIASLQNVVNERVGKISGSLPRDFRHSITSGEVVPEHTKEKIGRLMAAYEELIGISEVKSAHARVLSAEAKFIQCQTQRRQASKELIDIQNRLTEVRQELDRTQRGDDNYLELIKKEIGAIKEERIMRKLFEDLEREEREVFSELSSALRFSHEKERAQNEKTKYWSIVGSIIGAGLGILGTTINNKMKQNHLKRILEETSSQVAAIQGTVENLVDRINGDTRSQSPAPGPDISDVNDLIAKLQAQEKILIAQNKKLSKTQEDLAKIIKTVAGAPLSSPPDDSGSFGTQELFESIRNSNVTTFAVCSGILTVLLVYKYVF